MIPCTMSDIRVLVLRLFVCIFQGPRFTPNTSMCVCVVCRPALLPLSFMSVCAIPNIYLHVTVSIMKTITT